MTRSTITLFAALLSCLSFTAPVAFAEETAEAAAVDDGDGERDVVEGTKFAGEDKLRLHGIFAGGGVMAVDPEGGGSADTFTKLRFRSEFAVWKLSVGIKADWNLDDDFQTRKRDWDEPSDWPRPIDYIEFGEPREEIYARIGALSNVRLGHGTLMNHYQSAIDFDSPKTGAQGALRFDRFGFEAMTNDIVGYDVVGARAYVAPFGGAILGKLRGTAQVAVDTEAPVDLLRNTIALPATGVLQPIIDDDANYRYDRDPLVTFGFGGEITLLEDPVELVPYLEQNFISGKGAGLHAGTELRFDMKELWNFGFFAQGEYRVMGKQYLPSYFDAQYEVDRFNYPEKESLSTKRSYLDQVVAQNGYMGMAGFRVLCVELSGSFEGYVEDETDNRVTAGAEITGVPYVRARAFYTRAGVRAGDEIVTFDDRTTLVAELIIQVNRFLYVDLEAQRSFRFDRERRRYEPIDVFAPSLLLGWTF